MGMDVCFDYELAVAAGLNTKKESRCSQAEIREAKQCGNHDEDFIRWMEEEVLYVRCPDGNLMELDVCKQSDGTLKGFVRYRTSQVTGLFAFLENNGLVEHIA